VDDEAEEIIGTLQELELPLRQTFLLHALLFLTPHEIARLLGQQVEAIELDLQHARDLVRPHVSAEAGPAHA
jgi:DNA-directed RNA polymerase specialized sigma24 family protein